MPHLRIRNVSEELLVARSRILADRLQEAIGCERSWITLDLERSARIQDGAIARGNPIVEIAWFHRPEEIRARVSAILSEELKGDAEYVTAIFTELSPELYYEDGKNFA